MCTTGDNKLAKSVVRDLYNMGQEKIIENYR